MDAGRQQRALEWLRQKATTRTQKGGKVTEDWLKKQEMQYYRRSELFLERVRRLLLMVYKKKSRGDLVKRAQFAVIAELAKKKPDFKIIERGKIITNEDMKYFLGQIGKAEKSSERINEGKAPITGKLRPEIVRIKDAIRGNKVFLEALKQWEIKRASRNN